MPLHSEDTVFIVINYNIKLTATIIWLLEFQKSLLIQFSLKWLALSFCNIMQTIAMELQQMYVYIILF